MALHPAWVAAERPSVLFDLATAQLVDAKVLLPGATLLARMVARVRERAATRLWSRLAGMVDEDHRRRLAGLLEVPEGERVSRLERLRRPPTELSAPAMTAAMERIGQLHTYDLSELDLSGLPPARITAIARHATTARARDLARLVPDRRISVLFAFAVITETRATDDALQYSVLAARPVAEPGRRRAISRISGTSGDSYSGSAPTGSG